MQFLDEDDEEFLNFVPESPTENEEVGQQVRKGRIMDYEAAFD